MWQLSGRGGQWSRVPIRFVRCVIARAAEHGIDVQALLERSDIDPKSLESAEARVPVASYAMLERLTMQAMRDEALGYAQRAHKPGTWSTACCAAVHAGSLEQAVNRWLRCYALYDLGMEMRLVVDGDEAVICMLPHDRSTAYEPFGYERALSTLYRFICWLLEETLPLRTVEFEHEEPPASEDYRWLFATGTLRFGQPQTAMRFDRKLLDKPIGRDDRSLDALLLGSPLQLFKSQKATADWTTRLRERLAGHLPQMPEFEDIAAQLEIHPQTLRRRLADEGITYKEIKDQVRRGAAEYYLRQRSLSIEEVAFRCGFSEASALIRAFKRWNGMTPHVYAESRPRRRSETPGNLRLSA